MMLILNIGSNKYGWTLLSISHRACHLTLMPSVIFVFSLFDSSLRSFVLSPSFSVLFGLQAAGSFVVYPICQCLAHASQSHFWLQIFSPLHHCIFWCVLFLKYKRVPFFYSPCREVNILYEVECKEPLAVFVCPPKSILILSMKEKNMTINNVTHFQLVSAVRFNTIAFLLFA